MPILQTRMVSAMKWTKDRMANQAIPFTIQALVAAYKGLGATHVDVSCPMNPQSDYPIGNKPGPLDAYGYLRAWIMAVHAAGLFVTLRPADIRMEGIYGAPKAVGASRLSQQTYLNTWIAYLQAIGDLLLPQDELAPFPERTEGVFNDSTSWIAPNDPTTYANFFLDVITVTQVTLTTLGKSAVVGLSTNNASELLSGWMSKAISNKVGMVCIDHYGDDPEHAIPMDIAKYEAELRKIAANYDKPVYLQESAYQRYAVPESDSSKVKAYFDMLKRLVDDGVLIRFGYWGGWDAAGEGVLNSDFSYNWKGLLLRDFFTSQSSGNSSTITTTTTTTTSSTSTSSSTTISEAQTLTPPPVQHITKTNVKLVQLKGTPELAWYIPITSGTALISDAKNFAYDIPHFDDDTPDWPNVKPDGEATLN